MSSETEQTTTEAPTAPTTRTDVQWVSFVASVTAFVVWLAKRLFFGPGELPVEVGSVIQLGVPLLMSSLTAEWRWLLARRRSTTSPPTTPGS